jgi:dihydrofolate synthase/folylpolyglutamate synthase
MRARRRILVFAASRDKDVVGMLSTLLPAFDETVLTRYQKNPRSVPETELAEIAQSLGDFSTKAISDLPTAYQRALAVATDEDLICVTGSFFVAAELRDHLMRAVPALTDSR